MKILEQSDGLKMILGSRAWFLIQFCELFLYVVYSMKWTQASWLHTRCKLPRDVVTMVLWSRAIFTYFWFKKWRINSTVPKLIKSLLSLIIVVAEVSYTSNQFQSVETSTINFNQLQSTSIRWNQLLLLDWTRLNRIEL